MEDVDFFAGTFRINDKKYVLLHVFVTNIRKTQNLLNFLRENRNRAMPFSFQSSYKLTYKRCAGAT
jgi:hypothetical protein